MTKMDEPITDPEWVVFKSLKITKYNRTASVVKAVINILKDVPNSLRVSNLHPIISKDCIVHTVKLFLVSYTQLYKIVDVLPLNNRIDLHFSGIQEANECEKVLF